MNERCVKIMEYLGNNKSIKVNLLAELIGVSQATLRRDLDNLEKLNIAKRSKGFASINEANDTSKKFAVCYMIKKRIAAMAAQTIEDGETVMMESGSCCTLFAQELAMTHKNITIITNSLFILNYIHSYKNIKIILLGGYFIPDSQTLAGSIVSKCASNFCVDKLFIGADGFISEHGFMGNDYFRVETITGLAACANRVFMLTESEKFNRKGTYNLIHFDKLAGVITDDNIPKEAEAALHKNNVMLIKAASTDEKYKWRQFPGLPPILTKD